MSKTLELAAEVRKDMGKGASRRLRRQEKVPGILYGGSQAPTPILLSAHKVNKALESEAFYSQLVWLDLEGQKQQVILKDLHRHHFKRSVLHMDFQRVKPTDIITMRVPLHFLNQEECPGIKKGGVVSHLAIDVEVRCKVKDLPEFIALDLSNLDLDQAIHLSQLTLPKGIEIPALVQDPENADATVVTVHIPRAMKEEEAPAAEAETATEAKEEGKEDTAAKG